MTLDDAIKHCQQVANVVSDCECADEHRQLAEWLQELKEFKQKQTNEEWFCGLSTEEKAKWITENLSVYADLWVKRDEKLLNPVTWEEWLKEIHDEV